MFHVVIDGLNILVNGNITTNILNLVVTEYFTITKNFTEYPRMGNHKIYWIYIDYIENILNYFMKIYYIYYK